jgi:site-specific DNA-adenine methylase
VSVCYSPLRYPGGKQSLTHVLAHLINVNDVQGGTYVEPYAGGAGAALSLLFGEHVHRVIINDADRRIFSMWWALLNKTRHAYQHAAVGHSKGNLPNSRALLTIGAWVCDVLPEPLESLRHPCKRWSDRREEADRRMGH